MRRFWNWIKDELTEERILIFEGAIAQDTWYGDEITPGMFRSDLMAGSGNITIWINSPGGDVEAAAQIYNMLMEYKGEVTVKIDGIAASAASVVAMAGGKVYMSPVSMMMIHNPSTIAIGDADEMKRTVAMLGEYKESIINAYELKTSLPRTKLASLMDAETWMNAKKAVELGFANEVMYEPATAREPSAGLTFSRMAVANSLIDKLTAQNKPKGTPIEQLEKRLNLISHK